MRRFRFVLVVVLAALAVPAAAAKDEDEVQYVSVSNTKLLTKPMAFSPALATLAAGDAVAVIGKSGSYIQVKAKGLTGWIGARSLQEEQPKIGFTAKKSTDASAEEVAAATKGFNSEVEAEYKKNNPKLDFAQVDRLEARTHVKDPVKDLAAFRKEGKLGEFSAAAVAASGAPAGPTPAPPASAGKEKAGVKK